MPDMTLTLLFTQQFGAVDRIMSLLRRRGFSVSGITIERTLQPDMGRMTVVVDAAAAEQVGRHLRKLPDVLEVTSVSPTDAIQREFALARVTCPPHRRAEVMAVLSAFDARAASMTAGHIVVEVSGTGSQLDALFAELEPYGIEDLARTNPLAVRRVPDSDDNNSGARHDEVPARKFA